jgi:hypothetical protein
MKKIGVLLIAAMFSTAVFSQAGNNNKIDNSRVPQAISSAFTTKYPTIKKVSWYRDNDAYAARFYVRNEPCTALFSEKGQWLAETRKLSFGELRNNVRNSFSQGKFAGWQAHEVNEIQERNKEVQYRIHIRNGLDQSQRQLYYDSKGQLRKTVLM